MSSGVLRVHSEGSNPVGRRLSRVLEEVLAGEGAASGLCGGNFRTRDCGMGGKDGLVTTYG